MWPIVTDVYLCVYVCLVSVCLPIRHIRQPTETDEPIEVLFGMWTRVAPRNHVLNEALRIPPQEEALTWGIPEHVKTCQQSTYSTYSTLFARGQQRCDLRLPLAICAHQHKAAGVKTGLDIQRRFTL